eukprot:6557162-Prorocentrum_lima.AAC.1
MQQSADAKVLGDGCNQNKQRKDTAILAGNFVPNADGVQIGEKTVQSSLSTKRGERERPNVADYTNLYVKSWPITLDAARAAAADK